MDRLVVPGALALVALGLWLNPRVSPDRPADGVGVEGDLRGTDLGGEPGRVPIPRRGPSG
jgi:hypothetical protein